MTHFWLNHLFYNTTESPSMSTYPCPSLLSLHVSCQTMMSNETAIHPHIQAFALSTHPWVFPFIWDDIVHSNSFSDTQGYELNKGGKWINASFWMSSIPWPWRHMPGKASREIRPGKKGEMETEAWLCDLKWSEALWAVSRQRAKKAESDGRAWALFDVVSGQCDMLSQGKYQLPCQVME